MSERAQGVASNRAKILALWFIYRRKKRQKRNRLHWVHPINRRREEAGLFRILFEDLRNDQTKFFNYFRMSMSSFDELHDKLKTVLQRRNTKMRNCIQPIEMLAVTLSCLETIWWHMIEKRFCFDDEIALYEVPETNQEKNNNIFENAVFYDSVSVIAGRSVVTIEPLPTRINGSVQTIPPEPVPIKIIEPPVIISQPIPTRNSLPKFQLESDSSADISQEEVPEKRLYYSTSDIAESRAEMQNIIDERHTVSDKRNLKIPLILTESKSEADMKIIKEDTSDIVKSEGDLSEVSETANIDLRKKIFIEKRMSKSLYLNIECVGDRCREVPIIRQNSMPKFYLGGPEDHQVETAVFRTPSSALACPVPAVNENGFVYNLSSVVQMEKERASSGSNLPHVHDTSKRQFRDKIVKLRRIKSTMSAFHSHHM